MAPNLTRRVPSQLMQLLFATANVEDDTDVVDTRYRGYQSMRQSRVPQDHMADVGWWGMGGRATFVETVDWLGVGVWWVGWVSRSTGGHLEIQTDSHNTDFCYVIECYNCSSS